MEKSTKRKLPRYTLAASTVTLLALGLLYVRSELILRKFARLQAAFNGSDLDPRTYGPEVNARITRGPDGEDH